MTYSAGLDAYARKVEWMLSVLVWKNGNETAVSNLRERCRFIDAKADALIAEDDAATEKLPADEAAKLRSIKGRLAPLIADAGATKG